MPDDRSASTPDTRSSITRVRARGRSPPPATRSCASAFSIPTPRRSAPDLGFNAVTGRSNKHLAHQQHTPQQLPGQCLLRTPPASRCRSDPLLAKCSPQRGSSSRSGTASFQTATNSREVYAASVRKGQYRRPQGGRAVGHDLPLRQTALPLTCSQCSALAATRSVLRWVTKRRFTSRASASVVKSLDRSASVVISPGWEERCPSVGVVVCRARRFGGIFSSNNGRSSQASQRHARRRVTVGHLPVPGYRRRLARKKFSRRRVGNADVGRRPLVLIVFSASLCRKRFCSRQTPPRASSTPAIRNTGAR